jgi:hypothetical protein
MNHSYHVKNNRQMRKKETSSNKTLGATEATTRLYLATTPLLASYALCLAGGTDHLLISTIAS